MKKETKGNLYSINAVIEELSGAPTKIIAVPSELIHFTGKTQKGVFLAQLIYWSDKGTRLDGFIFKTRKEWTEETGLSESQLESITKEFIKQGFLETKVKKAMGTPTVHYKVDLAKLLVLIREFLPKRFPKNCQNNSEENGKSLTENTTEITQDIIQERGALSGNNISVVEGHPSETHVNVREEDEHESNPKVENSKNDSSANIETRIQIPDDFAPRLPKLYRAVKDFPEVSPSYVTEKFVRHYQNSKSRFTPTEWQEKWWDWVTREIPMREMDESKLENEQHEIIKQFWNKFYGLTYELATKTFTVEYIANLAGDYCSEETIQECFEDLVESENFGKVSNNYFNLREYRENPEWRDTVEKELKFMGLPLPTVSC